jgi:hypothetical protein
MRTVAVRLVTTDFAKEMALMRDWLDRHSYVPTRFIYDQADDEVVVSVEFRNERDAEGVRNSLRRQALHQVIKTGAGQSRQVCPFLIWDCRQPHADRSPNRS